MLIDSQIQLGNKLPAFSQDIIKNEPMFFSCSLDYAYEYGGFPTMKFINSLPTEWKEDPNVILDSRVHMLMEGWYPCIPGWHHDDVPRDREDGQPEYDNPSYRSEHAMALYNGGICPTEFAIGEVSFTEPSEHQIVYKEWHKEVQQDVEDRVLQLVKAPSEQIIFFNDRTWHQGNKAVNNGWRLFLRVSRNTNRKITNEIRRQVQVYLEDPTKGW